MDSIIQDLDLRLCFPTIHSLQLWVQRLEELNNTAPTTPRLSISFAINTHTTAHNMYKERLMRVHNHLLSLKDPVEWKPEILDNTPALFRLEVCTASKYELTPKNTFFVANVGDLLDIILWKAHSLRIAPSVLLNTTMSIYRYNVHHNGLNLVMLTPSYGYLDAEKWVASIDGKYTKSFTTADHGDNFVLAAYIDEKTSCLDGFVDNSALYGYYGLNQRNPREVLLTGTALGKGTISAGTRVDIADVDELNLGYLDYLYDFKNIRDNF